LEKSISIMRPFNRIPSFDTCARPMYFYLVADNVSIDKNCFPTNQQAPNCERISIYRFSYTYIINIVQFCISSKSTQFSPFRWGHIRLTLRYLRIWFTTSQCSFLGQIMYLLMTLNIWEMLDLVHTITYIRLFIALA